MQTFHICSSVQVPCVFSEKAYERIPAGDRGKRCFLHGAPITNKRYAKDKTAAVRWMRARVFGDAA